MSEFDLHKANADLVQLFRQRLGIRRGDTLEAKLRVAGRLVPKHERRAGRVLVEAERMWENPRLRRRYGPEELAAAERTLRTWLGSVDPAERRKDVVLGVLASLAFNFLLLAGAVIGWMAWSGRI